MTTFLHLRKRFQVTITLGPVYQINVQDVKNQYISAEHEALTVKFGGRGYPRTVLILNNNIVDPNNVEIISRAQLLSLANKFSLLLNR